MAQGRLPKPIVLMGGRATIFRGDCTRIIATLKGIDHIITDAPYEDTMHRAKAAARKRKLRTDGHAEPKPLKFTSIQKLRPIVTPQMVAVCAGWMLVFCTPEGIAPWRDAIEAAGARYKRACFWTKPDAAPQFNGQGPAYAVEPFVSAWCARSVSRWNGGGGKNWFTHPTNPPDRQGDHETEKPLSLMIELIKKFTKPGDVILDPFMGSGTTIMAALATGRRAIGIELDPKVFRLARARIESMRMGEDEARRYIIKKTGRLVHDFDKGTLFQQ